MGENKERCFVVDTNVLIATLINPSSPVWSIIESKNIKFFVPEFFLSELEEYRDLIKHKLAKKDKRAKFDFLISDLFKNIEIIPQNIYLEKLARAVDIMKNIDEKDSPFLALALSLDCHLWSNDKHFKHQNLVRRYTTKEILEQLKE